MFGIENKIPLSSGFDGRVFITMRKNMKEFLEGKK